MRIQLGLLFVLLALGSACGTKPFDGTRFVCSKTEDCAEGFACLQGECVRPGTQPGCAAKEICDNGVDDDCDNLVNCDDPDCAGQGCGLGKLCGADKVCACSPNATTRPPGAEAACGDRLDDDCDGQVDCADTDCLGRSCGAGTVCVGQGSCQCVLDGGTAEVRETTCGDGLDNDCDGQVDCADSDCATCGANGQVCQSGACVCSGNGGVAEPAGESTCGDGTDNDCDGRTDCSDAACDQRACSSQPGFACVFGACVCNGNGGAPQPNGETSCADARDNDCDGLVDCADTHCATRACGTNGQVCAGTTCACAGNGGTIEATETTCNDNADNDCDGLVDCADPNCAQRTCGSTAGFLCTSTSATGCTCGGRGGTAQASETTCNDGFDNDCDGQVDCADTGCNTRACGVNGRVCSAQTCVCSGNGGTAQASETTCNDGFDNDCDGLVDCADSNCNTRVCGANGVTCVGGACACSGGGGTVESPESTCTDARDNDCDGLVDCADGDCAARTCGTNGRICATGICACGGNGGTPQGSETFCNDGFDNDCDGLVDCADSTCNTRACGANGAFCSGTTCVCSGNGGTSQASETTCGDGFDNDCDGLVDCADTGCNTRACGANGLACASGACACSGNGGIAQASETTCNDGRDNDCDGLVDCADSGCNTRACGTGGRVCQSSVCTCTGNGGTAEPAGETTCGDGRDNDCDTLVDCADTQCGGMTCGANGRVCAGTSCVCSGGGGTPQATESSCGDGFDNDCDGLVDCADSNCANASCGTGCQCVGTSRTELTCTDGVDNDGDGNTDCADPDCATRSCGTGCTCAGGVAVETVCSDGTSNDGDTDVDCADSDCVGRACGTGCTCGQGVRAETACTDALDNDGDMLTDAADPDCCDGSSASCEICSDTADNDGDLAVDCADVDCNGRSCGTGCTCTSMVRAETICNNASDDDGDANVDCADSDCNGRACGGNGRLCNGTSCVCTGNGGTPQATETTCNDGFDNDCDGVADCMDPDCNRRFCGGTGRPAAYCCGTGTAAAVCKDLDRDFFNCGACGTVCGTNRECNAVVQSGVTSGVCSCNNSGQCPSNQTCASLSGVTGVGSHCTCSSNTTCGGAATCTAGQSGFTSPGFCRY